MSMSMWTLTYLSIRLVHICHLLCQQEKLLLGSLGEGQPEGRLELLEGERNVKEIQTNKNRVVSPTSRSIFPKGCVELISSS